MTRICHLLDGSACWEQRVALSQLLDHLSPTAYAHTLTALEPEAVAGVRGIDRPIELLNGGRIIAALAARAVSRRIQRDRIDLLHAWGVRAALACGASLSVGANADAPLVVELFDPGCTTRQIKMLRVLSRVRRFAIVASGRRLIRKLAEGGISPDLCVLIRPGVDFGLINRCRRGPMREALGLCSDHHVVIVPEPATPNGGRWEEFCCTVLASYLDPRIRAVIAGNSPDLPRIRRQARFTPGKPVLITPEDRYPFEQLVAIADTLLVGARDDVPTTAISWAMASETLVVAAAVHSVAELVAHKVNGLLFSPKGPRRPALSMTALFMDTSSFGKLKDVARAQAYEVFSVRRYVEQHQRLYENILNDRPLSEGIEDPATF